MMGRSTSRRVFTVSLSAALLALLAAPASAAPERAGSRLAHFTDEPMTLHIVELRRSDAGRFVGVAEVATHAGEGSLFGAGAGRLVFRATYDRASGRIEGRGAFEFVGDIRDGTTNTLVAVEARGRLSYVGEFGGGTEIPVHASGLVSHEEGYEI